MKNFVQTGDLIDALAPYAVASGAGFLVGIVFAVATNAAASGAPVVGKRGGIVDLPKATGSAWTAFTTKLYWDNTNKVVTTASTNNTLIGVAAAAAGSGDAVGRVLLIPTIA